MDLIIVGDRTKGRIETAIRAAEAGAVSHAVSYTHIENAIARIENRLNVPSKALEGVRYSVDMHAERYPKSQKHVPESTTFQLAYMKGKWRVGCFLREGTRPPAQRFRCLEMPEATAAAVMARMEVFE